MKISRNNYELFFMDYLDGNLKGEDLDCFLDFVRENPDLNAELEGMESISLASGEMHFSNKKLLYKAVNAKTNAEDFSAVAFMEGDLSELDKQLFQKHLDFHPQQAKELELLLKTRLIADETIVFSAKDKLYRKTTGKLLVFWGSRIAAVLIVAIALWTIFNRTSNDTIVEQSRLMATKLEIHKTEPVVRKESKPPIEQIKLPKTPPSEIKIVKKTVLPKPQTVEVETILPRQVENIEALKPRLAQLESLNQTDNLKLATSQLRNVSITDSEPDYYSVDNYIAEKVLGIKQKDKTLRGSLLESGLNLASKLSSKRLNYTSEDGDVSKINYTSSLVAFSIPVKK